jgi:hypothetical protein
MLIILYILLTIDYYHLISNIINKQFLLIFFAREHETILDY